MLYEVITLAGHEGAKTVLRPVGFFPEDLPVKLHEFLGVFRKEQDGAEIQHETCLLPS